MASGVERTALVIVTDGSEEIEAVMAIDVLRRAKVNTTVAGLHGDSIVTCSRGVLLKPDTSLTEAAKKGPFDVVVLPGGLQGAKQLAASGDVGAVLKAQEQSGKYIAGICAGPTAFSSHGVFLGKNITSYPCVKDKFEGYNYVEDRVVRDGKMITSRGPGTALEFAIEVVRTVQGDDVANQLCKEMLVQ